MIKSKIYDLREVYNFQKLKEIKKLLDNGYVVFIVEKPQGIGGIILYTIGIT